jgi:hypothetical protein
MEKCDAASIVTISKQGAASRNAVHAATCTESAAQLSMECHNAEGGEASKSEGHLDEGHATAHTAGSVAAPEPAVGEVRLRPL